MLLMGMNDVCDENENAHSSDYRIFRDVAEVSGT